MEKIQTEKIGITDLLFNPFIKIAGMQALLIGAIVVVMTAYIGSLNNLHFDGVLDAHFGKDMMSYIFVFEELIDWIILSIFLFLFSIVLSKSKIRAIDVFGTQVLARWPLIFVAALSFIPGIAHVDVKNISSEVIIFGLLSLLFVIWMVVLMFNAYKVSTNLKGAKLIVSFISAIILAEVLSKLAISRFLFS